MHLSDTKKLHYQRTNEEFYFLKPKFLFPLRLRMSCKKYMKLFYRIKFLNYIFLFRLDQTIEIYSTPSALLDESLVSYHTPPESDSLSKILFQKTQSLLRSRTRSKKKKNTAKAVTDSIYKSVEKSPKLSFESLDEGSNLVIQSLEEASENVLNRQEESLKRKLQPQEDFSNRFQQDSKKFAKLIVKTEKDLTFKNQEESSEKGYEYKQVCEDQEQIPLGNDELFEMALPKQKRSMATILQEDEDSLDLILQHHEESFELVLQPRDQIPEDQEESSKLFLQPGENHKGETMMLLVSNLYQGFLGFPIFIIAQII